MDNVTCTTCGADNNTKTKYCRYCGYELPTPKVEAVEVPVQSSAPPSDKKKKSIGSIVGIILFVLTSAAVQQIFFKKPSFDKEMMQMASEINKTCPMMVDRDTRFDNAVAMPNNSFQYNYTLVNLTKAEISIEAFSKYIEPNVINTVKSNPDMKIFRDNKTTIIYSYQDKNGVFVHKFSVTSDMYQ
jgi:hypothetical protein